MGTERSMLKRLGARTETIVDAGIKTRDDVREIKQIANTVIELLLPATEKPTVG